VPPVEPSVLITGDAVQEAVERSLEAAGWTVLVRWGRGVESTLKRLAAMSGSSSVPTTSQRLAHNWPVTFLAQPVGWFDQ
jgi:hypothetical protein